jgi:hypothetical protein
MESYYITGIPKLYLTHLHVHIKPPIGMILYCTYDVRSMYLSYTSKTSNGHALVFISIEPLHTHPNIHVIIVYVYHMRTTVKPVNTPGHVYNSTQRYNTCTIVHIRILLEQSPNIVGSYVCNLGNRPYVHYATYKYTDVVTYCFHMCVAPFYMTLQNTL